MTSPTVLLLLIFASDPAAAGPFAIEVVDDRTGRSVPLVELTTTSGVTYVTDSAGLVAFDEPGLMNERVFFSVKSHGYEMPKDGFGIAGKAFDVKPGGSAQIKLKRLNIAERLYRVTGEGIYRDSVLLGREPPITHPLLNAQVTGCDSVVGAVYRGKHYWFWGDTNQVAYFLGNYNAPGATSPLITSGQFDPDRGVNLEYFVGDKGFAKAACPMPGEGPTWIGGLTVLPDANGREQMLCGYAKIKAPMSVYRRGIAVWNDEQNVFERVSDFEPAVPLYPDGHTFRHCEGDTDYVYFSTSAPLVRVRATVESFQDLAQYEAYSCLKAGSRLDKPEIDRDEAGRVRYAWKKNTPPVGAAEQIKLIKDGLLKPEEGLLQFRDLASGESILAHHNSCTQWNERRQKWVNIILQFSGTSLLGEVWYAEADSPVGPWAFATKIISHDKYSFYNPRQHPAFSRQGNKYLYLEGTYTHSFSGTEHRTPRYDYNQVMYRLNLDDPRLAAPAAVYDAKGKGHAGDLRLHGFEATERADFNSIAFFALDRPRDGAVAVCAVGNALRGVPDRTDDSTMPIHFFAVPADAAHSGITIPLYEYLGDGAAPPIYNIRDDLEIAGYRRCPEPLCRVWPSPYHGSRASEQ